MLLAALVRRRRRRSGAGAAPAPDPITITDSFDRTDSSTTLGNTDTGEAWQTWGGTWGIETNRARLVGTSPSPPAGTINRIAYLETGSPDGTLQVTIALQATGLRIPFRAADDANLLWVFPNTTGYELWKTEAGSATELIETTVVPAAGDVVTVAFKGSLIVVKVNGTSILTWASEFNKTATRHGLLSINVNSGRFDDFSFTSDTSTIGVTDPDSVTATHAATPLTVPTYEGSGQLVHPKVLDMEVELGPGMTFGGYRYVMAFTPYPNSVDDHENPSIVASQDGDTWEVPAGLTNPITTLPAEADYHSDTHLVLSQDGTKVYCFYRRTVGTETTLYHKSSTDLVTWSAETLVYVLAGTELSPSIVWDGSQYRIYYLSGTANGLAYRTFADIDAPVVSSFVQCTVANLTPRIYWHGDVIRTAAGEYQAVFMTHPEPGALVFGASADGESWAIGTNPFLEVDAGISWVDTSIYRSSFVRTAEGQWDLWYPGKSAAGVWRLGRTTMVAS